MPKVTLTEKQKKQELLKRYIKAGLALTGIETYQKLAGLLLMSERALHNKMSGKSEFRHSELSTLFRVLHFDDQEILDVVKRS